MCRRSFGRAHFFCQPLLEFVLPDLQQSAIRMVDDDELLGIEQMMGNN